MFAHFLVAALSQFIGVNFIRFCRPKRKSNKAAEPRPVARTVSGHRLKLGRIGGLALLGFAVASPAQQMTGFFTSGYSNYEAPGEPRPLLVDVSWSDLDLASLAVTVVLPEGGYFSHVSAIDDGEFSSGPAPDVTPISGSVGAVTFAYSQVPVEAVQFQVWYGFNSSASGSVSIEGQAVYTLTGDSQIQSVEIPALALADASALAVIVMQPQDALIDRGAAATFSVEVASDFPVSYQWWREGRELIGATSATLDLPLTGDSDRGTYWVSVVSDAGETVSSEARLAFREPPFIDVETTTVVRKRGQPATFQATVDGTTPWEIQWFFDGNPITGATEESYTLNEIRNQDGGFYHVEATNFHGTSVSDPIQLNVDLAVGDYQASTATTTRSVGPGEVRFLITVEGKKAWSATGDLDWVEPEAATGFGFHEMILTVARNPSAGVRVGTISIGEQSWEITQAGNADDITELWAFGDDSFGQLGQGRVIHRRTPVPIAENVVQVSASDEHALWLDEAGNAWGMGRNQQGQLGDDTTYDRGRPVRLATGVRDVATAYLRSALVKTDGTVWTAGGNSGTPSPFTQLPFDGIAVDVEIGYRYLVFIDDESRLWGYGENDGQLVYGGETYYPEPVLMAEGVAAVSLGNKHTLFLKTNGELWGLGRTDSGQLGAMIDGRRAKPQTLISSNVATFAAGGASTFWEQIGGGTYVMGDNTHGQLGFNSNGFPQFNLRYAGSGAAAISTSGSHTLILDQYGWVKSVGRNDAGQLGIGSFIDQTTKTTIAEQIRTVEAGGKTSFLIDTSGVLWAVGDNQYGQLGTGAEPYQKSPVQVATGVKAFTAGESHSAYVDEDGDLWTMGSNQFGQLGDGSKVAHSSPTQVASEVASVAAGIAHSLFVKTDATAWGMGSGSGVFGNGQYSPQNTTIQQIATTAQSVNAAGERTFILGVDGHLQATGENRGGALGVGDTITRTVLSPVDSQVVRVSTGYTQTLLSKSDGTLWLTGHNTGWDLGIFYPSIFPTSPVQVEASFRTFCAGWVGPMVVDTDGTLWMVGRGSWGEAPNRNSTGASIMIPAARDVSLVGVTDVANFFVKEDRSLWGWGTNHHGQVGDGSLIERGRPVPIAANVTQLDPDLSGSNHTLFLASGDISALPRSSIPATTDFDHDGRAELLLRDPTTGTTSRRGVQADSLTEIATRTDGWRIVAVTDLDGDWQTDLVWENPADGSIEIWYRDTSGETFDPESLTLDPGMRWAGLGRFNDDVQPDLVMRSESTGELFTRLSRGIDWITRMDLLPRPTGYTAADSSLVGLGDFDGNGTEDTVWLNRDSGALSVQLMNGLTAVDVQNLPALSPGRWVAQIDDFDGDGDPDIATHTIGAGEAEWWRMDGTTRESVEYLGEISAYSIGTTPRDWVSLSATSQLVEATANTYALEVAAEDRWQVVGLPDWVELSSTSGQGSSSLTVTIQPNPTLFPREVTLVFGTATHQITQARSEPHIAVINQQPASAEVRVGASTQLSVAVTSPEAPTYQWRRAGVPIAGANESTLTIEATSMQSGGLYDVVVTNPTGVATSVRARISVLPVNDPGWMQFDPTWSTQFERNGGAYDTVAPLADGGFVLAGDFIRINDHNTLSFVKISGDGTVDTSFSSEVDVYGDVADVVELPHGQLLVGGPFIATTPLGSYRGVMRLQPDGNLDPTYAPGDRTRSAIKRMAVDGGGRAYVLDDTQVYRLTGDGDRDSAYDISSVITGTPLALVVTSTGQLTLAWQDGSGVRLHQFDASGALLRELPGAAFSGVTGMALGPDEAVTVYGLIKQAFSGGWRRFSTNGVEVESFAGHGGYPITRDVAVLPDGGLIISSSIGLNRVDASGAIVQPALHGEVYSLVSRVAVDTSGRPLFVFSDRSRDEPLLVFKRFGLDYVADSTVQLSAVAHGHLSGITTQGDGRIVVAGEFDRVNGSSRSNLVRLTSTGQVDETFAPTGVDGPITQLRELPDGRLAIAGGFTHVASQPRNGVAILDATGQVDDGFVPPADWSGLASADFLTELLPLTSGEILVQARVTRPGQSSLYERLFMLSSTGETVEEFQNNFSNWVPTLEAVGGFETTTGEIVTAGDRFRSTTAGDVLVINRDGTKSAARPELIGKVGTLLGLTGDHTDRAWFFGQSGWDRTTNTGTNDPSLSRPAHRVQRVADPISRPQFFPQSEGELIVLSAWEFSSASTGGAVREFSVRLRSDGSVDPDFGLLGAHRGISAATQLEDGQFLAATGGVLHRTQSLAAPAPVITGGNLVVASGETLKIESSNGGGPATSYQWYRNGEKLTGATASQLTLTHVDTDDAGTYAVAMVNPSGVRFSSGTTLDVLDSQAAVSGRHSLAASAVDPAEATAYTIHNRIDFETTPALLTWSLLIPQGWSVTSGEAPANATLTLDAAAGLAEWVWTTPTTSPIQFDYDLVPPLDFRGRVSVAALLQVGEDGIGGQATVNPDPLFVRRISPQAHTADTDGNFRLSLSELLRVIELYNTRAGSTRTGSYRINDRAIDGFTPHPDRADSEPIDLDRYHSSDTDQNGKLSLSELLRVIELYNTRSGTARTGAYRTTDDTPDGFTPDS